MAVTKIVLFWCQMLFLFLLSLPNLKQVWKYFSLFQFAAIDIAMTKETIFCMFIHQAFSWGSPTWARKGKRLHFLTCEASVMLVLGLQVSQRETWGYLQKAWQQCVNSFLSLFHPCFLLLEANFLLPYWNSVGVRNDAVSCCCVQQPKIRWLLVVGPEAFLLEWAYKGRWSISFRNCAETGL